MKKLILALLLVFAFTAFTAALDPQVNLESGIIASARVFPITAGESGEELAQYSIASAFKELSLDRFLEYCGTSRLRPRLATALSVLTPDQLCAGTNEFANVCSTTNCDSFREATSCSLSEAQLEQQCIERLESESQVLFADLIELEESITNRCNVFRDNYQGGEVRIGPADTSIARQACISHGFQYAGVNGIGECGSTSATSGNGAIGDGGSISSGGGGIIIGGGDGSLGGSGVGSSGGSSSSGGGTSTSSGSDTSDSNATDEASEEMDEEDAPDSNTNAAEEINFTCSDLDNVGEYTRNASLVRIAISNGTTIDFIDHCLNSNYVIENICSSSRNSTSTMIPLPCGSGYSCYPLTGLAACIKNELIPSSAYSCTDSDGSVNANVVGSVNITPLNGSSSIYSDTCLSSTEVREYSCQKSTSSNPTSTHVRCASGRTCSAGYCALIGYTCTDSDGNNASRFGTVRIIAPNNTSVRYLDTCINSTHVSEYTCRSSTSSTPTNTLTTCATGYNCTSGLCNSTTTPTTSATSASSSSVTPGSTTTPASSTGKAVLIGSGTESSIVILPQSQVYNKCAAQLRAKVFESYAIETIRSTCNREVKSTLELRGLFCRRPDNAYNECRTYLENRCQYAGNAEQECKRITTNGQNESIELLIASMNARCESQNTPQSIQFSDLSGSVPFSSAFIVNGQEDKLIKAIAGAQSATKPADPIYEFILKPFCMKYVEEKQGANNCKIEVEKIEEVIQFLNNSKPSLSPQGKEQANTLVNSVKITSDKFGEKCEAKDKGAGGICTLIFNR